MATTANYTFTLPAIGGSTDTWGTELNGNWTELDLILSGNSTAIVIDGTTQDNLTLTAVASAAFAGKITETVHTLASNGTIDLDPANGTIQIISLDGAVTFTESMANGEYITLRINDPTDAGITWPSMEWMFGTAPDLDTTRTNWVHIWQVGGTVYGNYIGYSS